jgi:hypothetical protein
MPSLLLSSQKGAERAGGPRAPWNALSGTRLPAGNQSSKRLKDHAVTIGKAPERLNLSVAEREAWQSVEKYLRERDQEKEPRANATDAYGIRELREETKALTSTVGKFAEGS